MAMSVFRMFRGARVAFAMLLGGRAMGFGGVFVMCGGFRMRLFGHERFLELLGASTQLAASPRVPRYRPEPSKARSGQAFDWKHSPQTAIDNGEVRSDSLP
jgi:hypothetical protein